MKDKWRSTTPAIKKSVPLSTQGTGGEKEKIHRPHTDCGVYAILWDIFLPAVFSCGPPNPRSTVIKSHVSSVRLKPL
jgi:hypothetical protein